MVQKRLQRKALAADVVQQPYTYSYYSGNYIGPMVS